MVYVRIKTGEIVCRGCGFIEGKKIEEKTK